MRASISPGQRPTGFSTCLLLKLLIPIGCCKRQNVIYLVLNELLTSQGSPLVLISLSTSLELLPASGPKPSVPQPPQVHEHSLVSDTLSSVFVSRMKPLHFFGHWGTSHGILIFLGRWDTPLPNETLFQQSSKWNIFMNLCVWFIISRSL